MIDSVIRKMPSLELEVILCNMSKQKNILFKHPAEKYSLGSVTPKEFSIRSLTTQ
jgi:hypothetical protein